MPEPLAAPAQLVAVGPNGKPWYALQDNTLLASEVFANQNNPPPAASSLPSINRPLVYTTIAGAYTDVGIGPDGNVFAAGSAPWVVNALQPWPTPPPPAAPVPARSI